MMGTVIKLPSRNSRARKKFQIKVALERYSEVANRIEAELRSHANFSDIRTTADVEALAANDPFRYMHYLVQRA